MANTAATSPTSAVNDASSGQGPIDWTNPGNALAADGVNATVSPASTAPPSSYLKATGFGFAIPSDATIDGVVVEYKVFTSVANYCKDSTVKLFIAGAASGTEKAVATTWPTTAAYLSRGGGADLWGNALTPAIVNDAAFGVGISMIRIAVPGSASLDHIRMTVYYTPAGGSGGSTSIPVIVSATMTSKKLQAQNLTRPRIGISNARGSRPLQSIPIKNTPPGIGGGVRGR